MRMFEPPRKFYPEDVQELRRVLKLDVEEFAQLLACTPGTIRNWESGRQEPGYLSRRLLEIIFAQQPMWNCHIDKWRQENGPN